jgi:tRNA (guanine37-N1)-methyltransferase
MKISIITVFPELHEQFLQTSLISRAQEKNIVSFDLIKLSDLCTPKERIDEPVCGPGAGMIIKPQVIEKAIEACEKKHGPGVKIFFSPQGKRLDQRMLKRLNQELCQTKKVDSSTKKRSSNHIILVCSRYEGIDARVEEFYADHSISVGDYVLMGGDVAAQVFLESFLRLMPGVVGKQESVEHESFTTSFLDYPEYGLPKEWKGLKIPDIILSGNHGAIEKWRKEQACKKTLLNRFDWFRSNSPTEQEIDLAKKQIPAHYVAIMHTDIVLKGGTIGHSSVTSLDLHDTARSCATYGVKNMFMVSPIKDQQKIMNDLLTFWKSDDGKKYNLTRFQAVSRVIAIESLEKTIDYIEKDEGIKPLIITTSAKKHKHAKIIDYFSQGEAWKHNRPVLFLFGTAQGLSDKVIDMSDFLLIPINGMTDYTHLSVRSAIAVILDRWLGINPKIRT